MHIGHNPIWEYGESATIRTATWNSKIPLREVDVRNWFAVQTEALQIQPREVTIGKGIDQKMTLRREVDAIEMVEPPRRQDVVKIDSVINGIGRQLATRHQMTEQRFQAALLVVKMAFGRCKALLPRHDTLACHIVAARRTRYAIYEFKNAIPRRRVTYERQVSARKNLYQMTVIVRRDEADDVAPNRIDVIVAPIVVAVEQVVEDITVGRLEVAQLVGPVNCGNDFREFMADESLHLDERHRHDADIGRNRESFGRNVGDEQKINRNIMPARLKPILEVAGPLAEITTKGGVTGHGKIFEKGIQECYKNQELVSWIAFNSLTIRNVDNLKPV